MTFSLFNSQQYVPLSQGYYAVTFTFALCIASDSLKCSMPINNSKWHLSKITVFVRQNREMQTEGANMWGVSMALDHTTSRVWVVTKQKTQELYLFCIQYFLLTGLWLLQKAEFP